MSYSICGAYAKVLERHSLLLLTIVFALAIPNYSQASTVISQDIDVDTTWTLADSPYVVTDSIQVDSGVTLDVEAGVIVKSGEGVELIIEGELNALGTIDKPIYFTSIYDDIGGDSNNDGNDTEPSSGNWVHLIFYEGAKGFFVNSVIRYGGFIPDTGGGGPIAFTGIVNIGADLTLNGVVFTDNGQDGFVQEMGMTTMNKVVISKHTANGIYILGGQLNMDKTTIEDNYVGIRAEISGDNVPVVRITNSSIVNNGRGIVSLTADLKINNSSIANNTYVGLRNSNSGEIDATGNWWGSASGPTTPQNFGGTGDKILYGVTGVDDGSNPADAVNFSSWLDIEPVFIDDPVEPECCSSIIFIPGIKGSVLEREGAFGVRDVLWPPSLNPTSFSDDIEQLSLTSAGESINDVRVNGLMETFYGVSIYDGFADFADDLVSQDLVNEWQAFPYDWRLSIDETINNGVKNVDGSVTDWVAEVERIAADSKSKKVTIVTHSMGGLMGKALIKKLEELNRAHLVESFVLVGSPELGTPQAIASILHGDNEGIPGGYATTLGLDFLVPADSARALSQNMPSAYNLLPSTMYHDVVDDPVATFSDASFTESWINCWGDNIDTYNEQLEFLSAQCASRPTPGAGQLRLPEVLSNSLLAEAEEIHDEIDSYIPPSDVRVVKVVGWGLPTVKSVKYLRQHLLQDYDVEFVREGDGTVVYASAISGTGEVYYLNLDEYKETTRTFSHRDLLAAQSVQTLIEEVLNNGSIENIDSIYVEKPETTQLEDMLKLSTHSPVLLGVYDTQGNFTGIDSDQNLDSTLPQIIENIPGSTFIVVGENQHVFLPKGEDYRFVYKGTGNGSTTVEIAEFTGNDITVTKTYTDIPTTPDTVATIDMSGNTEQVQVELDSDGDGEVDQTILPDGEDTEESKTFTELISELKEYIAVNVTHKSTKNKLLKQLNSIAKKYKRLEKLKSKNPFLSNIFNNNYILKFQLRVLERQVSVYHRIKRLSDEVKSEIINMLRQIENVI
ncbi:hypothetical protein H6789_03055 [Candidatus Nomurabacteria bacterium]|nr:hypothetical protein [Candidatus Nomurabacteria bacterium]